MSLQSTTVYIYSTRGFKSLTGNIPVPEILNNSLIEHPERCDLAVTAGINSG